MRAIRMLGSCLLTGVALGAVFAAGASASLPEIGRCVPTAKGTGEYIGLHCIHKSSTHKGEFNWEPGAVKKKFEGSTTTTITLETAKVRITCAAATFNGEWTGSKTASVTLDLIGCQNAATKKKCQSNPAKEGEIEPAQALEGELGIISNGPPVTVGLDLTHSPSIVAFTCNEPLTPPELSATLEGSVIGQIKKVGVMVPEFTLTYKVVGGKQVPESFAGGSPDTLTAKILKGVENSTEGATLAGGVLLPNEEALEIKARTV